MYVALLIICTEPSLSVSSAFILFLCCQGKTNFVGKWLRPLEWGLGGGARCWNEIWREPGLYGIKSELFYTARKAHSGPRVNDVSDPPACFSARSRSQRIPLQRAEAGAHTHTMSGCFGDFKAHTFSFTHPRFLSVSQTCFVPCIVNTSRRTPL